MFASSGEMGEPYEQRWVMESVQALSLVGTVVVIEHCA
jgi:hypothetical protein